MPEITDQPPAEIKAELDELTAILDDKIPPKILDRNLLIATWNPRAFGGLTEKWQSDEEDDPKRDLHALRCIAQIISRFDVIALQEVRDDLKSLRHMLKVLGPDWGFTMTDVTVGRRGNDERLAFLFDTRRAMLSGLACELVVPEEKLGPIASGALARQFARTPYAVSFRSAAKTFILVTLHVYYGGRAADRVPELKAIAEWLSGWATEISSWGHNMIVLGDFNIDRRDDVLYQAFTSAGLVTPDDMNQAPRTIFSDPDKPDLGKFYDQIAWFTGKNNLPALSLKYSRGGSFDFTQIALKLRQLTKQQLSWRISDHYPLWAEFKVRD